MSRVALLGAEQVLTLDGAPGPRSGAAMADLGIIEAGTVIFDGGRIAWVGPARDVPPDLVEGAESIDCRGKTVMPALVDAHTHVVWGGNRLDELEMRLGGADYEEIFASGGGILSSVRQTRALSESALFDQARARMERMRAAGTTTFEIKSGYGLDLDTELRQLRVVGALREAGFRVRATCLAAHAVPQEFRERDDGREAFIELVCGTILPEVARHQLADYCDVFCDRGAFTADESRRVLGVGSELGLGLRVHANEFGHTGGAEVAAELGAKTADHLLHLSDDERRALRERGVTAVLLPGTSLVLGKPFADGRALVDAGVPIAVATDCNPGSCALENLALVLGLAAYGNRLSPAEAVCAATHNAAATLELTDRVGRIEPGLDADVLVLSTPDYRDLVYHAGSPLLAAVYQAGRRVGPAQ